MKNNTFFLVSLWFLLVGCNADTPQEPSIISQHSSDYVFGGNVIASLVCCDESNTVHKGYIIATIDKDTIMSFYFDVPNDISGFHTGVWEFHPVIPIPYAFSYVTILQDDKRYIHYTLPAQDAARPESLLINISKIEQVMIIPN